MEHTIYTQIPLTFTVRNILEKLHIPLDMENEFTELANKAKQIAQPKIAVRMCTLKRTSNAQGIEIEDISFPGEILKNNLQDLNRVFIYLVTEGKELEEWAKQFDFLELFFVCELRQSVINTCQTFLSEKIKEQYQIKNIASINPCSLEIWNEEKQKEFYSLLQEAAKQINVTIQPNLLLSPQYSMSGIMFQSDKDQHNCSFCPNIKCPNRKSAYLGNAS